MDLRVFMMMAIEQYCITFVKLAYAYFALQKRDDLDYKLMI